MGADNSANTCRRITETVRDAGINGITLPRDEVVILTINRQNNFTFQYSAYFLTLMLNSFPSGCARLVSFKDHRQRAIRAFSANISNARRTSTDDTNLMGRFFYYRYRHVVLHTVVDHRFL